MTEKTNVFKIIDEVFDYQLTIEAKRQTVDVIKAVLKEILSDYDDGSNFESYTSSKRFCELSNLINKAKAIGIELNSPKEGE